MALGNESANEAVMEQVANRIGDKIYEKVEKRIDERIETHGLKCKVKSQAAIISVGVTVLGLIAAKVIDKYF
jgi:hypothetical protein